MQVRSMADIVRRQRPVTLPETASVQEACRLMREHRIGAILATSEDWRLRGLFTGRDAVSRVVAEALDPAATQLGMVMTRWPDHLEPGSRAMDALRMMQDGGYRHMPVVEAGKVVGIVSLGDFNGLERARLDEETGFWELL